MNDLVIDFRNEGKVAKVGLKMNSERNIFSFQIWFISKLILRPTLDSVIKYIWILTCFSVLGEEETGSCPQITCSANVNFRKKKSMIFQPISWAHKRIYMYNAFIGEKYIKCWFCMTMSSISGPVRRPLCPRTIQVATLEKDWSLF